MSSTSTAVVQSFPQALTTRSTPRNISAQSTPTGKATEPKAVEAKPSPGTFRHPRLAEITRRQSGAILTENNVRVALVNVIALLLSIVFRNSVYKPLDLAVSFTTQSWASDIPWLTVWAFRTLLLANTLLSLRPILPYNKPATYDDIPLTPSQRKLLGLPPSSTNSPAPGITTPSTSFITPPRYTRRVSSSASPSPSSQLAPTTDRRSTSANYYSSSPLSTSRHTLGFSPSPAPSTYRRTASGSPYSPSTSIAGSPLFHKAVQNRSDQSSDRVSDLHFDVSSRTSLVPGSSLGRSQSVKERGSIGGRSSGRRRIEGEMREKPSLVQKGVNYKWLYDKGFGMGVGGGLRD